MYHTDAKKTNSNAIIPAAKEWRMLEYLEDEDGTKFESWDIIAWQLSTDQNYLNPITLYGVQDEGGVVANPDNVVFEIEGDMWPNIESWLADKRRNEVMRNESNAQWEKENDPRG